MAPSRYPGQRIDLRLPSVELKKKLDEAAEARGCPTVKYILSVLEEAGRPPQPVSGLDHKQIQEDNRRLAADLHEAKLRNAALDAELRKLRNAEILKGSGTGEIDHELLRIIREGPPLHDYRLLAALGIEPGDDAARGIARQLQLLEATGFIRRTARGWEWKG